MNLRILFLTVSVLSLAAMPAGAESSASGKVAIGRIVSLDKKFWELRVNGSAAGERTAAANLPVYEKDTIQTIASQHVTLLMEDGTELVVGPSSRVGFENWNGRSDEGRRVRMIELYSGMVKAKVRKIYSQEEPFVIHNRNGAVAVRGTEFVCEAGQGGRLDTSRSLSGSERAGRKNEMEVHTLEGEVHLARDLKSLQQPGSRVAITAGQTSLVRENMTRPQIPHGFDVTKFTKYISKAVPNMKVAIVKGTTNARRSELSANSSMRSDIKNISPASPGFAQVKERSAPDRKLASVDTAKALSGKKENNSHERRQALGLERGAGVPDRSDLLGSADKPRGPPTIDGVHQAFQGSEQLEISDHNSARRMANNHAEEFGMDRQRQMRRDGDFRPRMGPPQGAAPTIRVPTASLPPPPPPPLGAAPPPIR